MKVIQVVAFVLLAGSACAWSYEKQNQKVWGTEFQYCAGADVDKDDAVFINRQSPIDIPTKVRKSDFSFYAKNKHLPDVEKFEAGSSGENVKMINTGRFVRIDGFSLGSMLFAGGLIQDDYVLEYIDIHWPSEHKLKGKKSDGEFQLFFTRKQGGSGFGTEKVAVVTFFNNNNRARDDSIGDIADNLFRIISPDSPPAILNNFRWTDLLTKDSLKKYYVYEGLTTSPPCDKGVTWLIGATKASMGSGQFKRFKDLLDLEGNYMKTQARQIQELGARVIYNSFNDGSSKPSFTSYVNGNDDKKGDGR